MSFSELKKRAKDIEAVRQQISTRSGDGDKDFLMLGLDKANNGYIRVRLFPAPEGEEAPMVTYSRFYWKNGPKTYSQNSLKNIGQLDPCQAYLSEIWKDYESGNKDAKKLYDERKKQTRTVVNLVVLEDKINPDNVGFVGKYRLPAFIKKMIEEALDPKEDPITKERAESFNPFDIFGVAGGRDLIIRVHEEDGNRKYSKTKWDDKSTPLFGGDETKLEEAYKKLKSLKTYVDPARHKSYDELAKILIEVLGPNDKYVRAALPDHVEAFVSGKPLETSSKETKSETKSAPKEDEKLPDDTWKSSVKEEKKEEKSADKKKFDDDEEFDFDFDDAN